MSGHSIGITRTDTQTDTQTDKPNYKKNMQLIDEKSLDVLIPSNCSKFDVNS